MEEVTEERRELKDLAMREGVLADLVWRQSM